MHTTEPSIIKLDDRINEFKTALTAGIEGIVKAANIYVSAIDENPKNAEFFRDELSECIPSGTWVIFEAVGRKWMHPKLLMGGMMDRKKNNIVKKLPYSIQERIFNGDRFKLLVGGGDSINVDLKEATPTQVEQLCGCGIIRSIAEQKAWLVERNSNAAKEKDIASMREIDVELPYRIIGGKVSFSRGAMLSRAEIKNILTEM